MLPKLTLLRILFGLCIILSFSSNAQILEPIDLIPCLLRDGDCDGGGGPSVTTSLTGPTSANINDYDYYYVSVGGASHYSTSYYVYGGTIVSQSKSRVRVRWTSAGSNRYVRADIRTSGGTFRKYRYVRVNQPVQILPATPSAITVSTNQCGNKTLTRGNPPLGVTWYWQTSSNGTSRSNSSKTYPMSSSGRRYLRARNAAGAWSSSSRSSGWVTVNQYPGVPTTPVVTKQCGKTILTKSDVVESNNWYWQGTNPNGTSTLNNLIQYEVTRDGTYYLRAPGSGGCWSTRAITVTVDKNPATYSVTGGGSYCIGGNGVNIYLSGSQTGVNYQLRRNGLKTGSPKPGTGGQLDFGRQTVAGNYTVRASRATCAINMSGSRNVSVISTPVYTVSGGGNMWEGIDSESVRLSGTQSGVEYHLLRNGTPTGDVISGTGSAITFTNISQEGTYRVRAYKSNCPTDMSGSAVVNFKRPFITRWQTGNPGGASMPWEFEIPTTGTGYNYRVVYVSDDGTRSGDRGPFTGDALISSGTGTYTVEIHGYFPRIFFNWSSRNDLRKILSVEQWGDIEWTSFERAFYGCSNLEINATDAPDLRQVNKTSYMFSVETAFNSNINHWNVRGIDDLSYMFHRTSFNQNLDQWDVSQARNMEGMFSSNTAFNGNISNWNTGQVTNFSGMFSRASSFDQNIGSWTVSSAQDMSNMFLNATSFNQNLNSWNVGSVQNMSSMFEGALNFNQSLNSWNVSSVTNMEKMFAGALNTAGHFNSDISSWNVRQVTNMKSMFWNNSDFNQNIGNWNVSNVEELSGMFFKALSFDQDISTWNVSKVSSMQSMFGQARSFNQDLSSWNVSAVTNMYNMFSGASDFNQDLGSWEVDNVTEMRYMLNNSGLSTTNYDNTLAGWATRPSLSPNVELGADGLFSCEHSAKEYLSNNYNWNIIDDGNYCEITDPFVTTWNTEGNGIAYYPASIFIPTYEGLYYKYYVEWENVNDPTISGTSGPFYGDRLLNLGTRGVYKISITGIFPGIAMTNNGRGAYRYNESKIKSVDHWGDNRWKSMVNAFHGCGLLQINADDDPDLQDVSNMMAMFRDISSVNQNIGGWDVSGVTDMRSLFYGTRIDQDLSSWDVSKVTRMDNMFNRSYFTHSLADWDISSVTNMDNMLVLARMTPENYDNTLIGWSTLDPGEAQIPTNINLGASRQLYCNGESARQSLIDNYQWSFTGDSKLCPNSTPFVTTWQSDYADAGSREIRILSSDYNHIYHTNYVAEWVNVNDPTISGSQNSVNGHAIIQFPTPGIYQVSITGFFPMIRFGDTSNARKLLSVDQWGDNKWINIGFYRCSNMVLNATDIPDLSNVTNTAQMFAYANKVNSDISNWDVSNITSMNQMFYYATSFNQDLSGWDISNVTNMDGMLDRSGISKANYDNILDGWSTLDPGETQVPTGITLGATALTYCAGEPARNLLTGTYSWNITGDAIDCATTTARAAGENEKGVPSDENDDVLDVLEPLRLYPNPANQYFHLAGSELMDSRLSIYDLNGKVILEVSNLDQASQIIDTSEMPNGLYLLRIFSTNNVQERKLIVQH